MNNNKPTSSQFDRRGRADRRRTTLKTFVYSVFLGRRRGPQRAGELAKPFYKDRYEAGLLLLVLAILILCITDAGLTLLILEKGGTELNPVMVWLLEAGSRVFFFTKYLITTLGVMVLLIHIHFRLFRGIRMPHFLFALCCFYMILVGYEVSILAA